MARGLYELDGIHPRPLGGTVESSQKGFNFILPKVKYQAIKIQSRNSHFSLKKWSYGLNYKARQLQGKYIVLFFVRAWGHPVIPPMRAQVGAARLHHHSAASGAVSA